MGQAAYGEALKKEDLELFSGEQIHQLFDLKFISILNCYVSPICNTF